MMAEYVKEKHAVDAVPAFVSLIPLRPVKLPLIPKDTNTQEKAFPALLANFAKKQTHEHKRQGAGGHERGH